MSWTTIGTIAAILIALISVWFAWRAHERAGRAERRSRRASLIAVSTDRDLGGGGLWRYQFSVRNVGEAYASKVQVWLTNRSRRKVSDDMFSWDVVLVPNGDPVIGFTKLTELVDPDDVEVWTSYTDADGRHTERLEVQLFGSE
jgi:hypothetical protein